MNNIDKFLTNKKIIKASVDTGDLPLSEDQNKTDRLKNDNAAKHQGKVSQNSYQPALTGIGSKIMNQLQTPELKGYTMVQQGAGGASFGSLAYRQNYGNDEGNLKRNGYQDSTPVTLQATSNGSFGNMMIAGGKPDGYIKPDYTQGYMIERLVMLGDPVYPPEPPHLDPKRVGSMDRIRLANVISPAEFINFKVERFMVDDPNYRTKPGERYAGVGPVYRWQGGIDTEGNYLLAKGTNAYNYIRDDLGKKITNPVHVHWYVYDEIPPADWENIHIVRRIISNTWQGRDVRDDQLKDDFHVMWDTCPFLGVGFRAARQPVVISQGEIDTFKGV